MRKVEIRNCQYCGKAFKIISNKNPRRRYCSMLCGNRDPKAHPFVWTKEQEKLLVKHYPKMEAKELSKIIRKKPKAIDHKIRTHLKFLKKNKKAKEIRCDNCNKKFKRAYSLLSSGKWGNFCSKKCRGKFITKNITGEKHQSWRGGYFPYFGRNWYRVRRKIRKDRKLACEKCGISEQELKKELHLHHITPRRFFEKVEESNHPENLMLLCNKCHKEVENGTYKHLSKMWETKTRAVIPIGNVEGIPSGFQSWNQPTRDSHQESAMP